MNRTRQTAIAAAIYIIGCALPILLKVKAAISWRRYSMKSIKCDSRWNAPRRPLLKFNCSADG